MVTALTILADDMQVVIVTYNSARVLPSALESVSRMLPGAAVLIVDNGSSAGTASLVGDRPNVRVLTGHGNIGYGAGVNLAVAHSNASRFLVINPDVVITRVDAVALGDLAGASPLGLVACLPEDGFDSHPPLRAAWGWVREVGFAIWQWFLKPRRFRGHRPPARPGKPAWIGGEAFMFSREEWVQIGGFDEAIFLYYEDWDLARRYTAQGLPLRASDAIRFEHRRESEEQRETDRGIQTELVKSWALRSLVQSTATWWGVRGANRAALVTLAALLITETVMRIASVLPMQRARMRRKASEVRQLRRLLSRSPAKVGSDGCYDIANAAYARAARRLGLS